MTSEFLQVSYSYGFKKCKNVIKMALKSPFSLLQNHKNRPAAGGSAPRPPSVTRLSCIGLFNTWPKLDNFHEKNIFTIGLPLLANSWLRVW